MSMSSASRSPSVLTTPSDPMARLPFLFARYSPEVFDKLAKSGALDHIFEDASAKKRKKVVRATLTELVVYLTAESTLDYGLLSDFFLTFRNFTTANSVVELLLSRLAWAVHANASKNGDEVGHDVLVRTFVVLRHWLLNFFGDDFVPNADLRTKFAFFLNLLYRWDATQGDERAVRIFDQLRKCWAKMCAVYWSMPDFDSEKPIVPGGEFGMVTVEDEEGTKAERRLTVLRYYNGPSNPPPVETPEKKEPEIPAMFMVPGSLVKGALAMSGDVGVHAGRGPFAGKELEHKSSKRSLRQAIKEKSEKTAVGKFFGHFVSALEKRVKVDGDDSTSRRQSVERIDILSARVIEELDRILKFQGPPMKADPVPHDSPPPMESYSSEEEEEGDVLIATPKPEEWANFTSEDSDEGDTIAYKPIRKNRPPGRISMIDNFGLQRTLSRKAPLPHNDIHSDNEHDPIDENHDDYETDTNDYDPNDDNNDNNHINGTFDFIEADRVSNFTNSITSISTIASAKSYESYDSSKSVCRSVILPQRSIAYQAQQANFLRRRANNGNLKQAVALENGLPLSENSSTTSLETGDSRFSMGSSEDEAEEKEEEKEEANASTSTAGTTKIYQQSNDSSKNILNNILKSYQGVDAGIAAELAAIPDDEAPEEDAIRAALEKLEGRYHRKSRPHDSMEHVPKLSFDTDSSGCSISTGALSYSESEESASQYVHISEDHSALYSAAFDDGSVIRNAELEQLNIPHGIESPQLPQPPKILKHQSSSITITQENAHLVNALNGIPVRTLSDELSLESIMQGNHLPFILDFSAKYIGQQLTLIERDALLQVDWKELIELRWTGSKLNPVQSWIAFLVERNSRGVELVISRFNLVVNWVKSEILLTWSPDERANVISRFIQIAHHCRVMQNFSTAIQLVLALGSPIIQKLYRTWKLVSASDQKLFRQLVKLIDSANNFAHLRSELENINGSNGCIPFVGLYLSDLMNNGAKDTFLTHPANGGEPQINFEKFQTSASIVKSLVQGIQWSSNYSELDFAASQEVLAKCLYVHSLTMEEMDLCFRSINEP
ncbi:hypothetical protein TRVA0_059S00452 [Trichomonascus vanleenenianus]|uniref:mitotic regulator LTE1 n=1 Tax=Trichomonascus vanleenenianus TaxID=2268995 RepID=UPI003ECA2FE6